MSKAIRTDTTPGDRHGGAGIGGLAPKSDWERRAGKPNPQRISFNPDRPSFRDLHALFRRYLPRDSSRSFLEVGCYPGRYAWYFHEHFDYRVSGLEYVEACADLTRANLKSSGIDARVFCEDFFNYHPDHDELWDVVFSAGFVEHYDLPDGLLDVVRRHYDLVRPGGHLVLCIPNHAGLNGRLLRHISPERYEMHNRMSYEDLLGAVLRLQGVEVIAGGYFGHFGFWNTGLYSRLSESLGTYATQAAKLILRPLEYAGRMVPNNSNTSPNAAVIARRAS